MTDTPQGLPPEFPNMPGIPTPESFRKKLKLYVDSEAPSKNSKYNDIDEIVALENVGLVITGLDELILDPVLNTVTVPVGLVIASCLTGNKITIGSGVVAGVADGHTLYVAGSNFPVQTGVKTITSKALTNIKDRRTDLLIIGVRIGNTLYLRHGITRGDDPTGPQYFEAYRAISISGIVGTYVSIPWNTYGEKTPVFDHSTTVDPENISINLQGIYVIEWRLTTQAVGGTIEVTSKLQIDQGWGFGDVLNTQTYARHDTNMSLVTSSAKTIINVAVGNVFRVQAKISSAIVGETMTVLNSASAISIFKL